MEEVLGARGHPKRGQATETSGPDLVAAAEAILYPGRDPETLTWPEQWEAVKVARQHLIDAGRWPTNGPSRCKRGHEWRRGDGPCLACKRLDRERAKAEAKRQAKQRAAYASAEVRRAKRDRRDAAA